MHTSNLRNVDLNLLVALDALLSERHVTRAANTLGLSQPAVSRALGRLRDLFDDPLLIRNGNAYKLTPRAERLVAPVAATLHGVHDLISAETFNPRDASGVIRVGFPDHFALLFAPLLLRRFQQQAPNLTVIFDSWSGSWRQQLADGALAITFGVLSGEEAGIHSCKLVSDKWVCVARRNHPTIGSRLTLKRFTELEHGIMSVSGSGPGYVDRALEQRGLARRIVFRTQSPVVAAMVVADTDLIVTTSGFLARYLKKRFRLQTRKLPLKVPPLDLPMVWHAATHRDPLHRWLRQQIREVAESIPTLSSSS